MIDEVWEDVKPLYEQLHCYVRGKLGEVYGPEKVDGGDGLLMGHLLGELLTMFVEERDGYTYIVSNP